jgi:plasmid stability protein
VIAITGSNGKAVNPLSALVVRDLDDRLKERLSVRAARHGRSLEAEIREILTDAVTEPDESRGLFEAILDHFGEAGGVELECPPRTARPRAADLA